MRSIGGLLVVVLLLLGVAATAWAVGLCDYTSPESSLTDVTFSFSYRYFNDAGTVEVDESGGRAAIDYSRLYDSPNIGYTFSASAAILLDSFVPTSGLGSAAGTFRYYMTEGMPLFGFGGVEAATASGQPQPAVSLSAGIGYGRFSDTTPLAKAFRIQDELIEAGTISKRLPDETQMAMAETIARQAEYDTLKDAAAAVVEIIQSASEVTVGAREVLMVEDVMQATGDERNCGWAVQAGLGYELVDPYGGTRALLLTASADAALAPDPESQLLLRASVYGPFNLLEENALTAKASYKRELDNGSSLQASYRLQRVQSPDGTNMSQAGSLLVNFAVGVTNLGLQLSLTNESDTPGWTIDVSVSAAIDLSS
jgi:hypothetical protein